VEARWQLLTAPEPLVKALQNELSLQELTARLLVQRGLSNPQEAWAFLNPRLDDLHDPYLLKDMDRVVSRLVKAIHDRERILIYGDYDVDGITAIAVLRRALEMLGSRPDFYLPMRLEEGYGLKAEVIKQSAEQGYTLIVSVDSGIRAFEACCVARQQGIDLIVTDHHLPDLSLPPAYAIVNPRRPDCTYPDKNLAAVGVVFKLVDALFRKFGKEKVVEHFLKLVAIGTIADMVPVSGENRVMVRYGLERLADPRNLGLRALLEGAGVGQIVSLFDVGFRLAPRINAVTRMGGGREVVSLFAAKSIEEAGAIVQQMNRMNSLRQREEAAILDEVEKQIAAQPELSARPFLVFCGDGWHRGVIGIVASRLVEKYHRPVLVLSADDGNCQGSGRGIPGFHLLEALDGCRSLLTAYGGHAQAAGCTVPLINFADLASRLCEHATRVIPPEALIPSLEIDAVLPVEQISLGLVTELECLAPFGIGNPVPIFASKEVRVAGGPWVLKEKHLKLQLGSNGSRLSAIWWKNGQAAGTLKVGSLLDVAYTLSRESYQGKESVLLGIRDIRPS
jgi:single-stranded-DNA-specific exonuclease